MEPFRPWLGVCRSNCPRQKTRPFRNDTTGPIPSELGGLRVLTELTIGRNRLTGKKCVDSASFVAAGSCGGGNRALVVDSGRLRRTIARDKREVAENVALHS